jgi:hypothetical protein
LTLPAEQPDKIDRARNVHIKANLLSFSAAALKCGARDRWIGWDFRHQYDRLHLIANNSRFLILPRHHHQNLASKVLSLCHRRINSGWAQSLSQKARAQS